MTRFARAKGSKASNEKTPEDSTPWDVMKEQLLDAKKKDKEAKFKEEAERKRLENYENFLKEQKVQKRKSVWCEFEETGAKKEQNNKEPQDEKVLGKGKKKKYNSVGKTDENVKNINSLETDNLINPEIDFKKVNENDIEEQSFKKKKKKEHKNKSNKNDGFKTIENAKTNADIKNSESEFKNKKQTYQENEGISEVLEEKNTDEKKKKKKKQTNKVNQNDDNKEQTCQENKITSEIIEEKKVKKRKKNKNMKETEDDVNSNLNNNIDSKNGHLKVTNKINNVKSKKNKKMVDGKPVRRKALNDKSFQLIINGKEVQLVRFDGFPVMKRDAERLEELKRNMIKKGIPKSEVQRTMKLERRRAEKALARVKRDVCYNCRKGGHNLSDCPDLKSKIPGKDSSEGICFKCGSTEHRQFECKVQKDKEFRFATCFICKEPGHIARQCPDNPKGLYPNGGGCKLCNDVTHLRKDCPTIQHKKEESSVKLLTLDTTDNIEDIGQKLKSNSVPESKKPKKIKF